MQSAVAFYIDKILEKGIENLHRQMLTNKREHKIQLLAIIRLNETLNS